jgi:acetoin utilization deacetylase AcuC-like enzyme
VKRVVAGKLGLVFFPAFDWAISPTHPEREERLLYTKDQIFEEGILDLPEIREYKAAPATPKDIARVHFCVPDVAAQATEAHLIAAGGTLVLARAFSEREIERGFALVRPPGHHAMRVAHGNRGFCNINNEAIMVEYLRRHYGVKRIAIVDTDVHHGDGTQDVYYNDPDVLFISFHQDGRTLYPGSGFPHELGGPAAGGFTLNLPLPPRTTDRGVHFVLDELVLPVLEEFAPEIIVNSAGQDNHYTDPLADMCFSAQGYAWLSEKLKPHLAILEGGYAIETALPYVNLAIILAMAGLDYSWVREPDYPEGGLKEPPETEAYLKELVNHLWQIWRRRGSIMDTRFRRENGFFRRARTVYYDTDQIREDQEESIRECRDCPGYVVLKSQARRLGYAPVRVYAVSIPWKACPRCQEEAREEYQQAVQNPEDFHHLFLQDKPADTYYQFDPLTQRTVIY